MKELQATRGSMMVGNKRQNYLVIKPSTKPNTSAQKSSTPVKNSAPKPKVVRRSTGCSGCSRKKSSGAKRRG